MKKRIGIDMREMKPFATGIGSHFLNLTHALVKNHPDFNYVLIINNRSQDIVKNHFKDLRVEYKNINILGGSYDQYLLLFSLRSEFKKLNLNLVLTDIWCSFPFMNVKYALMLYDLIGFHHIVKLSLKQKLYDRFWYKYVVKNAELCIASTNAVRSDAIKYLKAKEDKIKVVMPSVAMEYTALYSDDEISKVLKKYGITKKYIIYIGNRRPHKNIDGAIEIFEKLKNKLNDNNLSFVLVGSFDTQKGNDKTFIQDIEVKYPDISKDIKILGRIDSNSEVACLLQGSAALLHPALFEGYGLTPLEAMNCHTPVVASNIPAIRDVVGQDAQLYDIDDTEGFVEALSKILSDDNYKEILIRKQLDRVNSISWEKAARKLHLALLDKA